MTDYLREVEESMRAEKWLRLWQEHGKFFITLCVALVLGTAAQTAWNSWQTSKNREVTSGILAAVRTEDPAIKLAEIGAASSQPTAAMANLMAASRQVKNKQWDKAIALYTQTAENKSFPQITRDLARVQMVAIQMDHAPNVTADDLLSALKPVTGAKNSAWKARALILSASINAHKKNDFTAALADLAIAEQDTSLPASVINDIRSLKSVYSTRAASATKGK